MISGEIFDQVTLTNRIEASAPSTLLNKRQETEKHIFQKWTKSIRYTKHHDFVWFSILHQLKPVEHCNNFSIHQMHESWYLQVEINKEKVYQSLEKNHHIHRDKGPQGWGFDGIYRVVNLSCHSDSRSGIDECTLVKSTSMVLSWNGATFLFNVTSPEMYSKVISSLSNFGTQKSPT